MHRGGTRHAYINDDLGSEIVAAADGELGATSGLGDDSD